MLEQQEYLGTYIGGYQLTAQLSANSSSYTFLGETASLTKRQHVIIKWYYAVHLTTQQEKKDFLRKASMLKHLKQPFILPILATGLFIDTPYIVTPHMSKRSLYDRIHNPADLAWLQEHAVTIIKQIGQALAYSHEHDIAHGKLHPNNIFFNERDEVQLTDFQLVSAEAVNTSVNIKVGQQSEYYPGLATKDNDYRALGNIAHALLMGCKSPANQTPNILCDPHGNIPSRVDSKVPFTPVLNAEEVSALKPPQYLGDSNDISTSLSTLDVPTGKLSSIAIPEAEILPVLAAESPSASSSNGPSTHNNGPITLSCVDTYNMSMKTPTLLPTPLPVRDNADRDVIKSLPLSNGQQNGRQRDIIKKLLRDQGSVFLLSGILCIIIFSIIGTQFAIVPSTYSLKGQGALLLAPTAVELVTPQPTSLEIARTGAPIQKPTPTDLFPSTIPATVLQYTPSSNGPTGTPPKSQSMVLTVTPAYLNPPTCQIIEDYYTCTVTLALRANSQQKQSWYSSSDTTVASVSPARGVITQGSQVPITIQIALDCYGSGTITFTSNSTRASLTWSC